jgi:hypothetical protein
MKKITTYVAPSLPNDQTKNTLVIGGVDVVIPLEIDVDDDPRSHEHIRLCSEDGLFEAHLQAGGPDVRQDGDHPLLFCTFRDVPPGLYSLEVRIGNAWYKILASLQITRDEAQLGGQSFEGAIDGSVLGTPDVEPMADEPDFDQLLLVEEQIECRE